MTFTLRRLKREDNEFEVTLGYIVRNKERKKKLRKTYFYYKRC